MSWYKGESVDGMSFVVKDLMEGDWITQRPTRDIFLQNGSIITVKDASFEILYECLYVQLDNVHGVAIGEDVWFGLPELILPPPAANQNPLPASAGAGGYPSMPGNFASPIANWTPPTKVDDIQYGRSDTDNLERVDTQGFLAASNTSGQNNNANNSNDFEMDPIMANELSSSNTNHSNNQRPKKKKPLWNFDRSKLPDPPAVNRNYTFTVLCMVMYLLFTVMNIEVCIAIGGSATKWLYVLLWTLLGMALFLVLQAATFEKGIRWLFDVDDYGDYGSENKALEQVTIAGVFCVFILTQAFGIPAGWASAQITASEHYLSPDQTKVVSCWRNPNETITTGNSHFVFMEEPQWIVDWGTRSYQKVETENGSDDEGVDDGNRYNYCVAPIKYTGNVPCQPNLYAACFSQTTAKKRIASCSEADAKTCGWQYPSNQVTLRVLNNREQFWRVEDEDLDMWGKAMAKESPTAHKGRTPQAPVLIGWGFEGPEQIQGYQDTAEDLVDAMRISAYVLAPVVALVISVVVVVLEEAFD